MCTLAEGPLVLQPRRVLRETRPKAPDHVVTQKCVQIQNADLLIKFTLKLSAPFWLCGCNFLLWSFVTYHF